MTVEHVRFIFNLVGLSTDTKPDTFDGQNVGPGSKFFEKDTDSTYKYDGNSWNLKSISGAGLVNLRRSDGTEITSLGASNVGLLLTREIPFAAAASAKVRLDFGSARVVYARVRVVQTDKTAAAPTGFRFHVSVDAQSDAIDNLWLADPSPDDGTQDGQRIPLRADDFAEPVWEQDFVDLDGDPSPIRYLSFKPNVAVAANTAFRLFVEVKVI